MTVILPALVVAAAIAAQGQANPKAVALAEFAERCQAYLELREELSNRLKPLAPTASAGDLKARQQALAAALRTARAGAQPGDLVPPAVQELIRTIVQADMERRSAPARRAALKEVPEGPPPGINRPYPKQAALPTAPPLLLASLPALPDNLQYRFFGRHVVILDGDVEMVVDYVRDAVPQ